MTTTTTSIATNIIHQPRSVLDNPFASECYPTVHSVCLYTLLHATLIIVPSAEHIDRVLFYCSSLSWVRNQMQEEQKEHTFLMRLKWKEFIFRIKLN